MNDNRKKNKCVLDFDLYPNPGPSIQGSEAVECKPTMNGIDCSNMNPCWLINTNFDSIKENNLKMS